MLESARRATLLSILLPLFACGGGGIPAAGSPGTPDAPAPDATPAPQRPWIDAEVIGKPGDPVPGLAANYVTTMLGWLAPEGDVVFEAVIQWKPGDTLGCGILRRAPEGHVHPLLMQGQPLPETGGSVKHPMLPLESRGDVLVLPADVEGGTIEHGLFAVPRSGGAPRLLAEGRFLAAELAGDGTLIAQRAADGAILRVPEGGEPEILHPGCEPGFSTDGETVVVRRDHTVFAIAPDGSIRTVLAIGELVPGTSGSVSLVRGAWVNDAGAIVAHVQTSDDACPEALLRFDGEVETLAVCGLPAPSTNASVERIRVAHGRSEDVVFAVGTATLGTIVYCARPGAAAEPVAADDGTYRIRETAVVVDGARIAFGAASVEDEAVFRVEPDGTAVRLAPTGGAITDAEGAVLHSFPLPLGEAIDIAGDGATLVHGGLREERRPEATLGALLLMR